MQQVSGQITLKQEPFDNFFLFPILPKVYNSKNRLPFQIDLSLSSDISWNLSFSVNSV